MHILLTAVRKGGENAELLVKVSDLHHAIRNQDGLTTTILVNKALFTVTETPGYIRKIKGLTCSTEQ